MSLKAVLVGAGSMAEYHVRGFRAAGAGVAAVVDRDEVKGKALAAKYGIPAVYPELADAIRKVKPDIVSIITPNKFHRELALQALAGGANVFCEKPPALNSSETEEMVRAAERAGRLLSFNFNNRARPEAQILMAYIRNGDVGFINSSQAVWMRRVGIPGFGGWFTKREMSGGGPLIDLLHMLDLALWFMDYPEPEYILAQTFDDLINNPDFRGLWANDDPAARGCNDVENACHGLIRFKSGQILSLRSSWAEMIEKEEIAVSFQGRKAGGTMHRFYRYDGNEDTAVDECKFFTCEYGQQATKKFLVPRNDSMGRVESAENFVLALKGEAELITKPFEAVKLMRIIDAAYRSAMEGTPIKFL